MCAILRFIKILGLLGFPKDLFDLNLKEFWIFLFVVLLKQQQYWIMTGRRFLVFSCKGPADLSFWPSFAFFFILFDLKVKELGLLGFPKEIFDLNLKEF